MLNISLAGGQPLKARSASDFPLTADRQTVIYSATNHRQCELISILTHEKITNMNEHFYNDLAILNRVLEFPVTLVWTETRIFTYVLNAH